MRTHNFLMLVLTLTMLICGCANAVGQESNMPRGVAPKAEPKPEAPKEPAAEPKADPVVPAPPGEVRDGALHFAVPFDRGEGHLRLSRQNELLRVDVNVRFPYYAGDGGRDRGSALTLALSVNGISGRQLALFPAPIWQPGAQVLSFRSESTYSRDGGIMRLAEDPSFAGTGEVSFWDQWNATMYVDLRLVVVAGSTPAAVADNWMAGIVCGNATVRKVFPPGMDEQNPGRSPDGMIRFRFSELPERKAAEVDPRQAAIDSEKAQQEAMRKFFAMAQSGDLAGFQKSALEMVPKYPQQLWPAHLAYLISHFAEQRGLPGVDKDYLPLLKAYLDACPGQSQVHLDYLAALLSSGDAEGADRHAKLLFESSLAKGSAVAEANIHLRYASMLVGQRKVAKAAEILKRWEGSEVIANDPNLKRMHEELKASHAQLEAHLKLVEEKRAKQWEEELKFREEDARKKNPRMKFETTQGTFVVELFEDDAPNTVASMVALTRAGFYDGLTFHRFVRDFVIQGGCPKGDGTGDPGYRLKSEVSRRNHFRGMVGMACTGPKTNTEGSQFYVCLSDAEGVLNLSGNYVIVGRVIEGMEAADKLRVGDKMTKVTVDNLRDHKYEPDKMK